MKWTNDVGYLVIELPQAFNYRECLQFLKRSHHEILHHIKDDVLYKLLKIDEQFILCEITEQAHKIIVIFPMKQPASHEQAIIAQYIAEWFDLTKDLQGYYQMAENDQILKPLVKKYNGLRLIGIPDLFEALVWAIIGQQINLTFAYMLKKRFVEHFGEYVYFEGQSYWLFPTPERIAVIEVDDLIHLQFTRRKSEYIIEIAKIIASGQLTKNLLWQQEDYEAMKKRLMDIRGIGAWTADYVLMKCLQQPTAFPIADVGLHNALKIQLALERKPTIEELKNYAEHWQGWQAYATFYLWRSLYETI